jgi:hypothetical protein
MMIQAEFQWHRYAMVLRTDSGDELLWEWLVLMGKDISPKQLHSYL